MYRVRGLALYLVSVRPPLYGCLENGDWKKKKRSRSAREAENVWHQAESSAAQITPRWINVGACALCAARCVALADACVDSWVFSPGKAAPWHSGKRGGWVTGTLDLPLGEAAT